MATFSAISKLGIKSLDGMNAAGITTAQGLQAITGEALDYSNKSFENGRAFVNKAFQAKNREEYGRLQSKFAKGAFEIFVTKMMNISELYFDVLDQASREFFVKASASEERRELDGRR